MKPCIISVNGTDYYAPCDYLDYISEYNGSLVNMSNTNLTLYSNYPILNVSSSGYPRITCNANQVCSIRVSQSSQSSILNVSSFSVNTRSFSSSILLYVVILGVLICQLFKH